ncbi:MAG: FhaA domain-containing protein [Betaproteobacteria bacterium]
MSLFDRLEGWLEQGIEGLFRRRSGGVQPVEIGRKLARLMEEQKQISVSAVYAPNSFRVRLSPPDRARLASISAQLSGELSQHLTRLAHRQGYALVGPLTVTWDEDADLPTGTFQAEASFVVGEDRPSDGEAGARAPGETTMVFRRPRGAAPEVSVVHGPDAGRSLGLRPGENRLGRADDNDLVMGDSNVSRYHAVLIWENGATRLRDLGSRNGTRRNGELVEEAELRDGDELQVGLNILTYRER